MKTFVCYFCMIFILYIYITREESLGLVITIPSVGHVHSLKGFG